jgi:hypothetical protein
LCKKGFQAVLTGIDYSEFSIALSEKIKESILEDYSEASSI